MSPDGTAAGVTRFPFQLAGPRGGVLRGDVRARAAEAAADGPSAGATLVVCHGFKGFKDWGFFPYVSERLAAATGAVVITFNFSGCGIGPDLECFTDLEGFARNTFSREIDDLAAILGSAEAGELPGPRPALGGPVGLLGHSRGAAAALLIGAGRPRVTAVVTWSGIGSVYRYEKWFETEFGDGDLIHVLNSRTGQQLPLRRDVLEDIRLHRERLDMEEAARHLAGRLLIVHGDADEAVPVAEAHALHAAAGATSRLAIIEGAGHTLNASHPFPGTNPGLEEAVDLSIRHFSDRFAERPQ